MHSYKHRFLSSFAIGSFARIACLTLAGIASAATALSASAQATFTVTTLADAAVGVPSNCSNQLLSGSADPACSLRDALTAAAAVNGAAGTMAITVNFASSLAAVDKPGTILLGANALTLPAYTTVQGLTTGSGYTLTNLISIQGNSHIAFSADASVTHAALTSLTITNSAPALRSAGFVTVSQCTFTANSTTSGAAIYNAGTLTVSNSTFHGNAATAYGGAIYSTGQSVVGSISTAKNLTISGSTFEGNSSAIDGGAVYIGQASVGLIDSSTFTRNSAAREGAAVYINNASGLSRITNSILNGDIGGSECAGVGCNGAVRAFTFAGSEPAGANESGTITMIVSLSSGQVYTVNAAYRPFSTAENLASYFGGYTSNNYYPTLSAQGFGPTLVIAPQMATIISVVFTNPSAYFTVTPVPDSVISGTGNTVALDNAANFSALGSYGGPTSTVLPLPGSAALCAIAPPAANGTDQRGLPRTTLFGTTLCQDSGAVQTNYGLAFVQQPGSATANVSFSTVPSVQLTESAKNLAQAYGLVTLSDLSGTLNGITSSRTTPLGIATFPVLRVAKAQASDTLTASLAVGVNRVAATSNPFSVAPQPTATLSGSSSTFPLTAVSDTSLRLFMLTNTGTTALNITKLAVSSAPEFTQTNTCGLTLSVGEKCVITIAFHPVTQGIFDGSLALVSDAVGYSQALTLTGTAVTATATLTGPVAFPGTPVGIAAAMQSFSLANTGTIALAVNSVTTTGEFSQTNNCGQSLAVGSSCSISVVFKPSASGTRAGSLVVSTNATTPIDPVALTGTGLTLMGTLTGNGAFTSTTVGTASAAQAFTLTNTGTSSLSISAIATTGDFSQTNQCGTSLAVAATCNISVVFSPTVLGPRSGTLVVSSNAGVAITPAALSGSGLAVPSFVLSDSTGTTSTAITVVAGSTGAGVLKITSTNGFVGSITLNCLAQGTAPAGTTCTITSPITLVAGGTATANVSITTTARTSSAGLAMLPRRGWLACLVMMGLLLAALLRLRPSGRVMQAGSLLMLLLTLSIGLIGCAGGGPSTPASVANPNGTPVGTYTYTVTATSGGIAATQSILVTTL